MLACPLRQDEKTADNENADDGRSDRPAKRQSAIANRFIEKVADRRSERPRQDEGGPEQEYARDIGEEI